MPVFQGTEHSYLSCFSSQGSILRSMKRYSAFCQLRDELAIAYPRFSHIVDTLPPKSLGESSVLFRKEDVVAETTRKKSQISCQLPRKETKTLGVLALHSTSSSDSRSESTSKDLGPGLKQVIRTSSNLLSVKHLLGPE